MERKWVNIQDEFKISYEEEVNFWREFWIHKLGHFPTKIEKVGRKVTFKEDNEESERLHSEFVEFIEQRIKTT